MTLVYVVAQNDDRLQILSVWHAQKHFSHKLHTLHKHGALIFRISVSTEENKSTLEYTSKAPWEVWLRQSHLVREGKKGEQVVSEQKLINSIKDKKKKNLASQQHCNPSATGL